MRSSSSVTNFKSNQIPSLQIFSFNPKQLIETSHARLHGQDTQFSLPLLSLYHTFPSPSVSVCYGSTPRRRVELQSVLGLEEGCGGARGGGIFEEWHMQLYFSFTRQAFRSEPIPW